MKQSPVLFFHCVDAQNLNAQSNNTKAILAYWDSAVLPAAVFHFRDPDPDVARNPNVRLIKLPTNRLWKVKALKVALGRFSGVYYPGFAAGFDDRVRRMRRELGRGGAVICTLEGLPADNRAVADEEARLSEVAVHPVYCQGVSPVAMAGLNGVKGHSDLLIAISPFLQRMSPHLWPGIPTAYIPLGVNLEIFHAQGRVPHGNNSRVQVVSAGSFQTKKRPDVFLALARRHPQADFTWFGEGSMRAPLLEQVAVEGLNNVFFPGAVDADRLSEAFRAADIFTLPSVAEGVPKVTQEAAACGLPVVCMNYYEPFSVNHGVNGFQAGDDESYHSYIDALISDSTLRDRMGEAGAEMALDWSWKRLAQQWQAVICETVLQKASRAAG